MSTADEFSNVHMADLQTKTIWLIIIIHFTLSQTMWLHLWYVFSLYWSNYTFLTKNVITVTIETFWKRSNRKWGECEKIWYYVTWVLILHITSLYASTLLIRLSMTSNLNWSLCLEKKVKMKRIGKGMSLELIEKKVLMLHPFDYYYY